MSESTLITGLSIEDKASLTSGGDAWHFQTIHSIKQFGHMISDGPNGVRRMRIGDDLTNVSDSFPSTCFPLACALSSTWNCDLIKQIGEAIGQEALEEKVSVVLGPGVNIKRHPLGGRNFEYYSEDPYLTGVEAASWVDGVQSQGIGACLKHFAANNQETDRTQISVDIDERSLREIYLTTFEYVIKHAHPWSVMCAYNKINGIYAAENYWLLTEVLRNEWGFKGIVMSDWGACHDRIASIKAGLNLEMPPTGTDDRVVKAVKAGDLDENQVNKMSEGVLQLMYRCNPAMERESKYDRAAHHILARKAAEESIILLKNQDNVLPFKESDESIAVIGEFARSPRFQGNGSSRINPNSIRSFLDVLKADGNNISFAPGFTLNDDRQDKVLVDQAVQCARNADKVIMMLGIPEKFESEGFDRASIDLPDKQIELLKIISSVNPNIIVLLSNGGLVSIAPWRNFAKGILECWLLGEAGAEAMANIIFGRRDPSGRLSETIPIKLEDIPANLSFPGGEGHVSYMEGLFVGYRYFDTVKKDVCYPFGYGLSYTTFDLYDVKTVVTGPTSAKASICVRNTGNYAGSQVIQLYIAPKNSPVPRSAHELKGFHKVYLKPGECRRIDFCLDARSFAYWSLPIKSWHVAPGYYEIEFGTSSRDIVRSTVIELIGDNKKPRLTLTTTLKDWLSDPVGGEYVRSLFAEAGLDCEQEGIKAIVANILMDMPITDIPAFLPKMKLDFIENMFRIYSNQLDN